MNDRRVSEHAGSTLTGSRQVVIVDDNELSLQLLASMARELPNVVVHAFSSSNEALASCREREVDCFVLDYRMPSPDGIESIRLIRELPHLAHAPIVLVTGEGDRDVRYRALTAGANDFLQKPVDLREFLARVETHLALHQARKQLALHIDKLEASLREESARSAEHARRLEALWRIANNPTLDEEEVLFAMLREGARALRPGQPFAGMLSQLDGSALVPEAAFSDLDEASGPRGLRRRIELADTPSFEVLRNGGTTSWDDVLLDQSVAKRERVRSRGWRSVIATPIRAGGETHFLSYVSTDPTTRPFDAHDHAYIELLGSFFATHLQQRWQLTRIKYQSEHDSLTGLLNRANFRASARTALMREKSGAIVVANLDHFRSINESHGSLIGDAILVEAAAALQERARETEVVGRIGGDVFAVFLAGTDTREAVAKRVDELSGAFSRPFSTGDRTGKEALALSATIGVAVAPEDGTAFDELLARADAAALVAKDEHRGGILFYRQGMEGREQTEARLTHDLIQALAHDQFVLHVQPHVDLATMRVTGAEALVRWKHPQRGLIPPDAFIPFAERHGIIKGIGARVMRMAVDATAELRRLDPAFRLFFNLSAVQIADTTFLDQLIEVAEGPDLLRNLGVEITETAAIEDYASTIGFVEFLREHGVHVAIDDFGVGNSSLALLKNIPVDVVKIDRSFIKTIVDDERDGVIVDALLAIGARFGFTTIAEGVEHDAQMDWLRARGCRFAQGYALCQPLPLSELLAWMESHTANSGVYVGGGT